MWSRLVAILLMASSWAPGLDLINGMGGTAGFGENTLVRQDDAPSVQVDITSVFPGGLNYFGTVYNQVWINNNGNITFDAASPTYIPSNITAGSIRIIAPFYADVDTRPTTTLTATPGGTSTGSNQVWYDLDPARGIFTVTWDDVGYFANHTDKLNAFQLRLKRRSGGGFTIEFRYENIDWVTGDASVGTVATAGWSGGNGVDFFALPQAGNQTQMLDLENIYATRTIIFNVNPDGTIGQNRAPVANDGSINVRALTSRDFRPRGSDPDGDDLVYLRENPLDATKLIAFPTPPATFATAQGGSILVVNATTDPPTLRYTPPNLPLPFDDSFIFGVRDTFDRDSNHATYTFHVAANVAPVATDSTITVYANEANPIQLSGTDANDDVLTYAVTGGPGIGSITGTPPSLIYTPPVGVTSGTTTITFTASDGLLTSTGTLTLNIVERPAITILSPNGGEHLAKNSPMTLSWTVLGNITNVTFHYSADGGESWHVLAENLPVAPSTATVTSPNVDSSKVLISAVDAFGNPIDITDGPFTVGNPGDGGSDSSCGSGSSSGLLLGFLALLAFRTRRQPRSAA